MKDKHRIFVGYTPVYHCVYQLRGEQTSSHFACWRSILND